ncbi:cytochrome P450 4C1-like [Rhynchophorus ferrugineus]|uniref:cytochrome P450 4C1-like n=1 Tax=Rhynchophorus ferrugineus TaxID=354439 RepID=UPI003FCCE7A2
MTSFHQKNLDQFVTIFTEKSYILNGVLEKQVGKDINIYDFLTKCSLDTLCETSMKLRLNVQNENNSYGYMFDKVSSSFKSIPRLQEKQKANNIEEDILYQDSKKPQVFLDCIVDSGQFSSNELRDEVSMFLFAGTETAASTLCFVFAVLGMFQDVQNKVLQEIVDVVGLERDPEPQDLHHLQYTERVIKESLRLFPVASLFGRSVTQDTDVGDFIIPKYASVYFGVNYIHKNAKYWPNPLKFDPDRFLPEEVEKRHPCTYIPFSYGPRNCIGKNYSMMNMKVILSIVLRKYKIHCAYKRIEDIKLKMTLVLRFKDGAKVSVTLR